MIAALAALATIAQADPSALRGPDAAVVIDAGSPDSSVAMALPGGLALAVEGRTDGGAVGAAAGGRLRLTGDDGRIGVWVGGSAGLVVPTLDPTVGVSLTPWGGLASDGQRVSGRLVAVVPAVLAPTGARLPALAEGGLAVRAGPAWLGARVGFGARFDPGFAPALLGQGGLVVGVDPRRAGERPRGGGAATDPVSGASRSPSR